MGLIGHNKRFLQLLTGAEGSMNDARLLRHSPLFHQIANGEKMPNNKTIKVKGLTFRGITFGDGWG